MTLEDPVAPTAASPTAEPPAEEPTPQAAQAEPVQEESAESIPPHSLVWAKFPRYPWWPAKTLKQENVPHLLSRQPHAQNAVPILFFGTREYAWMPPTALRPFEAYKQEFSKQVKGVKLVAAFKEAQTPEVLDPYLKDFASAKPEEQPFHVDASTAALIGKENQQQHMQQQARRAGSQGKRKSVAGDGAEGGSSSKKKKAVAPKAATPSEMLLALRHKLQKILLSDPMRTDDFEKIENIMAMVEAFPVTFDLLKETKIGKVIKRISLMTIENEPARVVQRCKLLLEEWRKLLPPLTPVEVAVSVAAEAVKEVSTGEAAAEDNVPAETVVAEVKEAARS